MKPDKLLLGTLWCTSLLLAADFWFDMRFGFNIFLRAHWRYLADIQTGPDSVAKMFYISMIAFVLILPLGLYIIARPNRRIRIENRIQNTEYKLPTFEPSVTAPARPPQLTIPTHLQRQTASLAPQVQAAPSSRAVSHQPTLPPVNNPPMRIVPAETESAALGIVSAAEYHLRKAPTIGGIRINIWAVGTGEILLVGLIAKVNGQVFAREGGDSKWKDDDGEFASPVWQLAGAVEKVRALFDETLDKSLKVDIKPFVIIDGGRIANTDSVRPVWNAFGIEVFNDMDALSGFMDLHRNMPPPEDEREDFEAFVEYIDTVGEYFNG